MSTVVYVTSPGGVFLDVLALAEAWGRSAHWIAVPAPDTTQALAGRSVEWSSEVAPSRPWDLVLSTVRGVRVLRRLRPEWVVSAGTGVALPWFVAARACGVPSLWVETMNIRGGQGRTAVLCSRLAERVVVQSPERLTAHRRVLYVGELY